MTKEDQIEEMSKYICNVCEMGFSFTGDCSEGGQDYYKRCTLTQETAKALYEEGYRKVPDGAVVLTPEERGDETRETNEILEERDNLLARVGVLGREVEELKAKLKECDIADDYTIGFATYLMQKRRDEVDRLQSEIKRLKKENTYLLKACEEKFTFNTTQNKKYSVFNTVRKVFADEVKAKLLDIFGKTICSDLDTEDITDIIDELLKEYEK